MMQVIAPSAPVHGCLNLGLPRSGHWPLAETGQLRASEQNSDNLCRFADFPSLSLTPTGNSRGFRMKYNLLSAALIVAAMALETTGYGRPGTNLGPTLFVAGIACEFWFWIRVAKKARRHGTSGL